MPLRYGKTYARAGDYRKRTYINEMRGRRRAGIALRRIGSKSLSSALARVHTFKRVGEPMEILNPAGGSVTLPTLTNATGAGASYPYLQVGSSGFTSVASAVKFGGAFSFQLAQCANVSEITNLFDNYRIKKVVLRFDYSINQAPAALVSPASQQATAVPIMHVCPDYDDNAVPASRTSVLENGYARTVRLDKTFTMTITPRAQSTVTSGSASGLVAGGLLPLGQWLDCASTQVPHFGVKFWMDDFAWSSASVSGVFATLRVTPTYYIEAKNVV